MYVLTMTTILANTPIPSPRYGTREAKCFHRNVYFCYSNIVLKTFVILYFNVYEPPAHLRDGGGMYLGRPKYIVLNN